MAASNLDNVASEGSKCRKPLPGLGFTLRQGKNLAGEVAAESRAMSPLTASPRARPPTTFTALYFQLLALTILWGTSLAAAPNYLATLPLWLPLLLVALFYRWIPPRLEEGMRLALTGLHLLMLAGVNAWQYWMPQDDLSSRSGFALLLLAGPITSMAWSFLFVDRPRLGQGLTLLHAGLSSLLVGQWARPTGNEPGLALIMLLSCVVGGLFGQQTIRLQRQAQRSAHDAQRDPLTGLFNRRAFDQAVRQTVQGGTLALLDLDHFKAINDHHGHTAGDRVLRVVADVLLDHLPAGSSAYRWGGEEFALLLPGLFPAEAEDLLDSVRQEVQVRSFAGGTHVTLSAGLGQYVMPEHLPGIFAEVDAALLAAKRAGRNRVVHAAGQPPRA